MLSATAFGDPIVPDARYVAGGVTSSVPVTQSLDFTNGDYQVVHSAGAYGGADPQADVQGNINYFGPNTIPFASYSASVTYYYLLTGPADATTAPIILHVAGHASATGSGTANASVIQGSFFGNQYLSATTYSAVAGNGVPFAEFEETVSYDEILNQVHGITVRAFGSVGETNGSYQAVSDPIIEIDQSAPNAHFYSITWSTNIPAPGVFVTFAIGAAFGSRRYRQSAHR